jgi:hypothetical protein
MNSACQTLTVITINAIAIVNGAVNVAWCCGFYPAKSLNGPSSRILNGPGTKSRLFEGPKKSRAPQKVKILCKGPFRILELGPFSDLAG